MDQEEINKVRASVHQQCGNRVKIQLDRGRNKIDIQEGVIQEAYPSVFTVLVDDETEQNPPQLLSFSYTDIITKERGNLMEVFAILAVILYIPLVALSQVSRRYL